MTQTIPDLWPDDIRVDVLTPLVILRAQESLISRKTQGILQAKVLTATNDTLVQHQLDLIAPALNHYRRTVLTAKHSRDMVYPVKVKASCFVPKGPLERMALGPQFLGESPQDEREAATQDELIELVRQVLHSGEVRATIQSLIARSNEANGHEPPAEPPAETEPGPPVTT
jgi:hypothetical protein